MFVTTEGDFKSSGGVTLLTMEYEDIIGIHFEDRTPYEETACKIAAQTSDKKGPPMMQVCTYSYL